MNNQICKYVLAVALLALASPALAQQSEHYNRTRGELGPGASAPSHATMLSVIERGSPGQLWATLERGEFVECFSCIPAVSRLLLSSDDARVREIAAWWLKKRQFGLGPVIHQMRAVVTSDPMPLRRARAAEALGEFMEVASLPILSDAARSDGEFTVRAAAVRAIGRLNASAGNQVIADAMADDEAEVRRAALSVVLRVNFFRQHDALLPLLADSDADVRRRASLLVGEFRVAEGAVALAALLRGDSEVSVRQAAAWALGRVGGTEARSALSEARTRETSSLVLNAVEVAQAMR